MDDFPDDVREARTAYAKWRYQEVWAREFDAFLDQSCVDHPNNQGEEAWKCSSTSHVKFNHITTPFFQRLDLRDAVGLRGYVSAGGSAADYAIGSASALEQLRDISASAAEAAKIDFVPGVYGPNCTQHVGTSNNRFFLQTTVDDRNGNPRTFAEAVTQWLLGEQVDIIDDPNPEEKTSRCAPATDDLMLWWDYSIASRVDFDAKPG
jgi:hypothetical protein